MAKKLNLKSEWNTVIRKNEYVLLFEPTSKIKNGDTLRIYNLGETMEYLVVNTYESRLIDVIKDDIIHKWYFSDLVEYALQHDPDVPYHHQLTDDMSHKTWNEKLKSVLSLCIQNHYGKPIEKIVKVVVFTEKLSYKSGDEFDIPSANWKRVKRLL